ncbi:MAG: hypothetical protein EOP11_06185 [Proteobacteria bacterium]|nr:MAG: hypothetical protein EOP11_06185 [Pseudomonadota bacterium]
MKAIIRAMSLLALLGLSASPRASAAEAPGESVEEYLQKLSTIPDVVNRKDPFIQAAAPFSVPKETLSEGVDLSVPALERYPLSKYEIVATLLGDQYPRALLRLPKEEKGKVLIVKEKDKLGNKGGIITKILKDGVSVVQKTRSPLGFIDKQDTIIRVGSAEEDSKKDEKSAPIIQGAPAPAAQPFTTGGQGNNPRRR